MYMIACKRVGMEVRCPPTLLTFFPTIPRLLKLSTNVKLALHFHLTVAASSDSNYEDTEFVYQPLLNEQRDRELLDLLPDYLTEEICFPRGQAAKFYCKVVDSMSRKIVLEEEEE
jgi:hypothetical protein